MQLTFNLKRNCKRKLVQSKFEYTSSNKYCCQKEGSGKRCNKDNLKRMGKRNGKARFQEKWNSRQMLKQKLWRQKFGSKWPCRNWVKQDSLYLRKCFGSSSEIGILRCCWRNASHIRQIWSNCLSSKLRQAEKVYETQENSSLPQFPEFIYSAQ